MTQGRGRRDCMPARGQSYRRQGRHGGHCRQDSGLCVGRQSYGHELLKSRLGCELGPAIAAAVWPPLCLFTLKMLLHTHMVPSDNMLRMYKCVASK
eukprot:1153827-Pelagomonas_calceolata.AAC.2